MQQKTVNRIACFTVKVIILYLVMVGFICGVTNTTDLFHADKIFYVAALWVLSSKLCNNEKNFWSANIGVFVLLSSILAIYFVANDHLLRANVITYLSFVGSLSCLITMAPLLVSSRSIQKSIILLFLFPCLFILILLWGYYLTSNAWFSADTMLAIMQTNLSESKEFLKDYFNINVLLVSMVLLLSIPIIIRNAVKNSLKNEIKFILGATVFVCICSLFLVYKTRVNIVTDIGLIAKQNLKSYNDFRKKMEQRKERIFISSNIKHVDEKGIYVLVIGESQNRNHMSVYGYQRDTTPWLKSMMVRDDFVLFNEVYSCHTHTVPVLTYALTAKNQYNGINLSDAVSILEIAEAVGYDTAWISNQVKYGAWDTPVTVIASEANQQVWLNNNLGETTETNAYDLKLVDALDNIQYKDKMLLVFHLMGSHGSYAQRYPKSFAKFGTKKTIDEYDNSMLYNDYVVSKIYEKAQQLPNFQAMVYFADHADAVDQNLAHDASNFVWPMTEVPMYLIFSKDFENRNRTLVDNLRNARNKMFTNDLLYNLMKSLLGIKNDANYEAINDLSNELYDDNNERFKTLYGNKKLSDRKISSMK